MPLERMQQRRDTTAVWAQFNPVLLDGEIGIDSDLDRYKIGDGTTAWLALPFSDQTAVDAAQDALDAAQDAAGAAAEAAGYIEPLTAPANSQVATYIGSPGATRTALTAEVVKAAFFARFGDGLQAWDDFAGPDVANLAQFTEGLQMKSGHSITADGAVSTGSIAAIEDSKQVWPDGTPQGPIRIAKTVLQDEPTLIGALVSLTPQTTTGNFATNAFGVNAPIGACVLSYAQGSIQGALFKDGFELFVVESPIVDPYPKLLRVVFTAPLKDDGTTLYAFYVAFDRPTSTATVWIPGLMDKPQSVTDPRLALYWGKTFGWQERRNANTDGRFRYHAVGAGGLPHAASGLPAVLTLNGVTGTYLTSNRPSTYVTVTDPEVSVSAFPTGGWANGVRSNAAFALWNTGADHRSFAAYTGPTGKPIATLSRDGVETITITCPTALPANARHYRVRYEHTTAKVRFFYSVDPILTDAPTWTELGTAGGEASGFAASTLLYNPPRRTKMQVGTRDNSSALMFTGDLARVVLTDSGVTIADRTLRTLWLASSRRDSLGNLWHLQGPDFSWSIQSARIDALEATIASAGAQQSWLIDIDPLGGAHAHTNWATYISNNACLHGGYRRTTGTPASPGDAVSWDIYLGAGNYEIEVLYFNGPAYGIITASIDGSPVGQTIDAYAVALTADQRATMTGIVIASGSKKRLTLTVTGKNASSSAYGAALQHVQVRRTS